MDVKITLEHGPLSAEIEASEDEKYTDVLDDLAAFLKEHPDLDGTTKNGTEAKEAEERVSEEDSSLDDFPGNNGTSESTGSLENEKISPLLKMTGLSEDKLIRLFEVEEGITPRVLAPEKVPGESKRETILNASAVLLTIWEECYDETWMKTSELSNTLEQSGLPSRTDYIYNNDNWQSLFNQEGKRRGSKLSVTRLGKDIAEETMEEMTT